MAFLVLVSDIWFLFLFLLFRFYSLVVVCIHRCRWCAYSFVRLLLFFLRMSERVRARLPLEIRTPVACLAVLNFFGWFRFRCVCVFGVRIAHTIRSTWESGAFDGITTTEWMNVYNFEFDAFCSLMSVSLVGPSQLHTSDVKSFKCTVSLSLSVCARAFVVC